jgi:cytochrome c
MHCPFAVKALVACGLHNDSYKSSSPMQSTQKGKSMFRRDLFLLVTVVCLSGSALADQALATTKNCMACHAIDKKLVGPAYKEISKKYAGQIDAVDKLANKITKGGSGAWGVIPMPANPQVNEVDAKKLAGWVMSL